MDFLLLLIVVSVLHTGDSISSSNVTLVGCFSVKTLPVYAIPIPYSYRIQEPLTWAECFQFCLHRITTHMAIQQEPGSPTYNYCYCLGEVREYLTSVNNGSCISCPEQPGYYFGGNNTLSVYKIREKIPLSVVLATSTGISIVTDDITTTLNISTQNSVHEIEIDFANDAILFAGHDIYRSNYIAHSAKYGPPYKYNILYDQTIESITLDWQRENLYYSIPSSLNFLSLKKKSKQKLANFYHSLIGDCAVDSYNNLLFLVIDTNLYAYSLNPFTKVKVYSGRIDSYEEIFKIALDFNRKLIYLLVKVDDITKGVVIITYDNTVMRLVFSGNEMNNATAFDVFDDLLVWSNKMDERTNIVYSCRLIPRCLAKDLNHFKSWNNVIHDIKIYHSEMQQPPVCERLGCSHNCVSTSYHNDVCSCPDGMELGTDKKSCKASGDTKKNITHLGCFSSTIDYRIMFRVQQSLKWLECINMCNHRLNRLVGIEYEESGSVFVHCYCNDLIDGYLIGNSSSCQPCSSDNNTYCGDKGSVALYQLREKNPLAILLATDVGIQLFTEEMASPTLLVNVSSPVQQVDYDYREGEIFFKTEINNYIYRSYYKPQVNRYVVPKTFLLDKQITGKILSVDWIHHDVVFEEMTSSYNPTTLFKVNFDQQNLTRILDYFDADTFVIDPLRLILLKIKEGHLHRINLATKAEFKLNNFKHTLLEPYMSIDIQREIIYVIASEEEGNFYIMSMNYTSSNRRILFSGQELSEPFGLSVLNGEIVWGNNKKNQSSIYRCKLTPTCGPHSLQLVYQTKERIYDLKIYHPSVQNITLGWLCLSKGCSHNCSIIPQLTAVCHCPPSMTLSADDKTCVEMPPSTMPTPPKTEPDDDDDNGDFLMDFATTEKSRINPPITSGITLEGAEIVKSEKGGSQTFNIISKINSDNKTEDTSKFGGNKIDFIEIFVVCVVMIIIVLMLIQTILIKKRNRTNDYDCTYREASQIELMNTFPQ